MKRMMRMLGLVLMLGSMSAKGQAKIDAKRMEQDIEVTENILSTLIRQQLGKRNFFPVEVEGSYTAGYGVTFRLPHGGAYNMYMLQSMENFGPGDSFTYSFSTAEEEGASMERELARKEKVKAESAREKANKEREITDIARIRTAPQRAQRVNRDSLTLVADKKFMEVAKNFLADYGDVISQLKPEEKIIITNRSEGFEGGSGFRFAMAGGPSGESRRSLMSAEAKRDDIIQLKQGKITRDQFLSRLKIVNTESLEKLDPDLEVLSSMFSRLYREDLSKTYFTQGDVTYERLKAFGVIYYLKVYSSNENGDERWSLPTVAMHDVSQGERDKKVKELYPVFESELKENVIEYGRTLRSLKDDEQLVFKVRLTKCTGCGIPTTLEISVKNSVLKEYSSGKASKEATLAKVNVKKEGNQ